MLVVMGIMGIRMANNWVTLSSPGGRIWYPTTTLSQKPHSIEPTVLTPATKGWEKEKLTTSALLVFDPVVPWPQILYLYVFVLRSLRSQQGIVNMSIDCLGSVVGPQTSYLTSLFFSFLICKLRMIAPTSLVVRTKCVNTCKVFVTMAGLEWILSLLCCQN